MSTTQRYRAFARECIRWAHSAQTIKHREILLDMATHWVHAAARLDYLKGQSDEFDELVRQAQAKLATARVEATNGSGQSKDETGEGGFESAK
jgi:hypothetical protein